MRESIFNLKYAFLHERKNIHKCVNARCIFEDIYRNLLCNYPPITYVWLLTFVKHDCEYLPDSCLDWGVWYLLCMDRFVSQELSE